MDVAVLELVPWDIVGAAGMFAFLSWLVATGRLVPKSTVDRIVADKDARITYVELANTEQRGTISNLVAQVAELTASGRLSVALLQSINAANQQSESGNVAPAQED
ncbi:hypothetical protein ABZ413_29535 [Nocardia rhamnosiphila]|uniref:hypothetical protein n=1 Tax=Nocardia rhamnosiphila TaxID=426716 RepID=UPI0033FD4E03